MQAMQSSTAAGRERREVKFAGLEWMRRHRGVDARATTGGSRLDQNSGVMRTGWFAC